MFLTYFVMDHFLDTFIAFSEFNSSLKVKPVKYFNTLIRLELFSYKESTFY